MIQDFLNKIAESGDGFDWNTIPLHREYDAPPVNVPEALRYAGYIVGRSLKCEACPHPCEYRGNEDACAETEARNQEAEATMNALLQDGIGLLTGQLTYRVSYCCIPLWWDAQGYPILPFAQHSDALKKNLEGCKGVLLFAATIGAGIDRLIRRFERVAPSKALILQGLGAERVESLCDLFDGEITRMAETVGRKTHPRFSPGYGDLPIQVQPEVLRLVDAERRLGISLNESFLMSPSKSVTAMIGIE